MLVSQAKEFQLVVDQVKLLKRMKEVSIFLFVLLVFVVVSLSMVASITGSEDRVYIVYMGAATSSNGVSKVNRAQTLMNSLVKRDQNTITQKYKNGFAGFAARMSSEEAHSISQQAGVVSVFPDPVLQLHTTRSWDFLQYENDLKIDSASNVSESYEGGTDTIIGVLDTGIWPESESFKDLGMDPIPSQWKGICMQGHDFNSSTCNRKLVGARYYIDPNDDLPTTRTPRDSYGHGTHVAATAAGNLVPGASYYGLATGTARGGSVKARVAVYTVCPGGACRGSFILSAFDDAIKDGVHVLSLSLGASAEPKPDFKTDPIAIGSFHAVEQGITVVCSAGNDGPGPKTVVNVAPWVLTVAASTIDRNFESDVVLGNNEVIKGEAINFADIQQTPTLPLIYGANAKSISATENAARKCYQGALDEDKIKGKIVLCDNDGLMMYSTKTKFSGLKAKGGIGMILVDELRKAVASSYADDPITVITPKDKAEILSYINSTSQPLATILATKDVEKLSAAPAIAYFSSRGPTFNNLLKPDVTGPGVVILAAWIGNDTAEAPAGKGSPMYNLLSGTSMSCPHVSGIVASVISQNPGWSPSAIKSAIMTTAYQTNNLKEPIATHTGTTATPYDYGAGEVSPFESLQPGLVYEAEQTDYLHFLCNYGYNVSLIKLLSRTVPAGFSCPENSSMDLISDLNYPSIAVSGLNGSNSKLVSRTVKNVGNESETVYTVSVTAPNGLTVQVKPDKLQFTKTNYKLSYQVGFSTSQKGDMFGSITWTNGKHKVRSAFVVNRE